MDRLNPSVSPKRFSLQAAVVVSFGLILLAVLVYKALEAGWFAPRTPLALDHQPAFMFFNRHKGCACVLAVYELADTEIRAWPEEARSGVQLLQVDLDDRPEVGALYKIVRAPTLLLLDSSGQEAYRQEEIISETRVFDLVRAEKALVDLLKSQREGGDSID